VQDKELYQVHLTSFGTVIDGVECFAGNAIGCAKTVDDVINDL
jgi:hypothetical protein